MTSSGSWRAPRCAACPLRGECVAAPIEPIELAARRAAHAPQRHQTIHHGGDGQHEGTPVRDVHGVRVVEAEVVVDIDRSQVEQQRERTGGNPPQRMATGLGRVADEPLLCAVGGAAANKSGDKLA